MTSAEPAPKPSIGRIVHYMSRGSADGQFIPEPRAAIVTAVNPPRMATPEDGVAGIEWTLTVDLCVLNPTGLFFDRGVPFSEHYKQGHWSWPPRV